MHHDNDAVGAHGRKMKSKSTNEDEDEDEDAI
jgi:hypothetical protein